MKISKRLKTIASFVKEDAYILDVGCDHGLLDIYLVLTNSNIKAIASDINEKPLIQAQQNIKKYNLEDKITIVQGNGLEKINKNVDTVIIAGMGTSTILDILQNGDLTNIERLIISSNNDYYDLRKNIVKLGFKIIDETIVFENKNYYPIIEFEKGYKKYKKIELQEGPILLNKKEEIFLNYINSKINRLENILKQLNNKHIRLKFSIKKEISKLKKIC